MKKIITMVLCFVFALSLAGCNTMSEQNKNDPSSNSSISEQDENQPISDSSEGLKDKELLKLQCRPILELGQTTPTIEIVDIAYSGLIEIDGERYTDNSELQVLSDYVENNFNIELDENWKVFVHYYDIEQTVGMVQFQYFIGKEIETNKNIIFNLNNGKVDMIFHSCLDGVTDEEGLQDRVSAFKTKYVQEQYQLKEGEKFVSETANYSFNYDTGDLVYCYNVFFSYGAGVINNDYGTTCLIDKEGNAINHLLN